MSEDELEELRREFENLRVITTRLQLENNRLRARVHRLELQVIPVYQPRVQPQVQEETDYQVGDRITIFNPTCPFRNRHIIPQDATATVTRVSEDWIYFECDSGVKTKRYRKNIRRLE